MKISKQLCNMVSTSLIFTLFLASTVNTQTDFVNSTLLNQDAQIPAYADEVSTTNKELIYQTLKDGFDNLQTSIDFVGKGVTSTEVMACIYPFLNENPMYDYVTEPIYTDSDGNVVLNDEGNATYTFVCKRDADGYAKRLIVDYNVSTVEEAEQYKQEFIDNMDRLITETNVNSVSSTVEKILLVHDYFETEFKYSEDVPYERAYGLFKYKAGVCSAYAIAFKYVMNYLGIPCEIVNSYSMSHSWNVVQVDGEWYHVDTTWDDPLVDILGCSYHRCLLVSDAEIMNQGHYDWETSYECTSTKYDNYIWKDVKTQAQYYDGSIYYLDNEDNFVKVDVLENTSTVIFNIPRSQWGSNEGGLRTYTAVIIKDGIVYYNDNRNIYARKVDGSDTPISVFSLTDDQYVGCNMYGLYMNDDGDFTTSIKSSADATDNFVEIKIDDALNFDSGKNQDDVLNLDVNGDGFIDIMDFLAVKNHIYLNGTYDKTYDVNLDGEVSNIDLLLLKKNIFNTTNTDTSE
ncbi:MAG: dockerin type I domain-containing protein [Ruminococcus sp.]|nr:dockerin type I domain-containing protein [Ruminococcus sp.]